jgi:hypothetical protein
MTSAFTGRARRRTTTRAVRAAAGRVLITAGGLGNDRRGHDHLRLPRLGRGAAVPRGERAGPSRAAPRRRAARRRRCSWASTTAGSSRGRCCPAAAWWRCDSTTAASWNARALSRGHGHRGARRAAAGCAGLRLRGRVVRLARVGFDARRRPRGDQLRARRRAATRWAAGCWCTAPTAARRAGAFGLAAGAGALGQRLAVTLLAHSTSEAQTRITVLKADGTLVRSRAAQDQPADRRRHGDDRYRCRGRRARPARPRACSSRRWPAASTSPGTTAAWSVDSADPTAPRGQRSSCRRGAGSRR